MGIIPTMPSLVLAPQPEPVERDIVVHRDLKLTIAGRQYAMHALTPLLDPARPRIAAAFHSGTRIDRLYLTITPAGLVATAPALPRPDGTVSVADLARAAETLQGMLEENDHALQDRILAAVRARALFTDVAQWVEQIRAIYAEADLDVRTVALAALPAPVGTSPERLLAAARAATCP